MNGTRVSRNVFKLFLSVTAAALLTLCIVMLVGCGKKSTGASPSGETYYLYDEDDDTFDEREKIFIDGEKCVISIEGEENMKDLNVDGKIEYGENDSITGSCGMIVTKLSDILSKEGLEDLYKELGVSSFEMKSEANIKLEFEGKKFNNVVVVTKQSMTIRGFEGLLSGLNGYDSSEEREVYCIKGQTPDYSMPIAFDFNGGTLNGEDGTTIKTDRDGKLVFPEGTPQKDGYIFSGYSYFKDGVTLNEGIKVDYPESKVYAVWRKMVFVTYNVNSSEYKINSESVVGVAQITRVIPPEVVPIVSDPTTKFKGWYSSEEGYIDFDFGFFVEENCELEAKWYSASDVKDYNDNIHTNYYGYITDKRNRVFVHFREKTFCEDDLGVYGGCLWKFTLYGVKNGQKDASVVYGSTDGFKTTDPSGMICVTDTLQGYKGGDAYLEIKDGNEVKGGFIVSGSDFDSDKGTHIFVDEYNMTTYRTRW